MISAPLNTLWIGPHARGMKPLWQRLTLVQRFIVAGGVVMLAAMAIIGSWVSHRIEEGVVRNTATATALYMDSFVSPLTQELAGSDELSPEATDALENLFRNTPLGEKVLSFKIWKKNGLVTFASDTAAIGRRFEPTEPLLTAWSGTVAAEIEEFDSSFALNGSHEAQHGHESQLGLPLVEIYSPVRAEGSGEVIAVAEFYTSAVELQSELFVARSNSWIVVAAVMFGMAALLYSIVNAGSRTIRLQQSALEEQLSARDKLARQNEALRLRVQSANARSVELSERYLRRIGADLHDGPAQVLALAALRIDSFASEKDAKKRAELKEVLRQSVQTAMEEIRAICRGLTLPAIEELSFSQLVEMAAEAHMKTTGRPVTVEIAGETGARLTKAQNICFFRMAQEGLSNAFRHGGGAAQKLTAAITSSEATLIVSDEGPGIDPDLGAQAEGLGLAGLRERVESLGGHFSVDSEPGRGTRLIATIKLD